jgi:hypothetical protein
MTCIGADLRHTLLDKREAVEGETKFLRQRVNRA